MSKDKIKIDVDLLLDNDVDLSFLNKVSRIDSLYVYETIHDILDSKSHKVMCEKLSEFSRELSHNIKVDTGLRVGDIWRINNGSV